MKKHEFQPILGKYLIKKHHNIYEVKNNIRDTPCDHLFQSFESWNF